MKSVFRIRNSAVRECRLAVVCMLLILLPSGCLASSIVGRVINRSRNQPSAGDVVILYSVDRTMYEMARTKSSQDGTFRFDTSGNFPYLVAVFHQKVSYHTRTLRGVEPVEVPVYDTAQRINGIRHESNTLFVRPQADAVNVTEFFVISNQSNPPRTMAGVNTFNFMLPGGAVMDSTVIQPPATLPLRINATPCGPGNHYYVDYPIRPGITRLRAVYHLKQPETAWIALPRRHVAESVALLIPESLQLETGTAGVWERRSAQSGLARYVTTGAPTAGSLAFRFSAGASHTGTGGAEAASLASTNLQSGLAQAPTSQPVRGSAPSRRRPVLPNHLLITFFTSLALMAMIAVGGNLYAHRLRGRGKRS